MSETARPTLQDVTRAMAHLGDRVLVGQSAVLEPFVIGTVQVVLTELERFIPGLEDPPNADAARAFGQASEDAMAEGQAREALSYALRGLSCSPHDPGLCYLAASACIEVGAVETALRLLYHTLWINPGHLTARRDLEALTAYLEGGSSEAA